MKYMVLIADADEQFRNELIKTLDGSDEFEVVGVAADGEETLQILQNKQADILVLDMMLPKKDGISVMKAIGMQKHKPTVLATSAFINGYVASSAANLGVRYLMLKPLDICALMERMEEIYYSERLRLSAALRSQQNDLITDTLHRIGVPAHIKGYQYLREAINVAVEDMDVLNNVSRVLYAQVAVMFQTTPKRVERAIQHAVEVAWDRGDLDTLQRYFGYTVSNTKGRPTNTEFISLIADQIRLWMKENAGQLK